MPWRFDPDHSQVEWAVRYLGISVIRGAFDSISADVSVDDPNPERWMLDVRIDPASVTSSGYGRRREAMRGENFLEADRFPEIRFRSRRCEARDGTLRIEGDLTLHGVTRPATLTGRDNGEALDRRGVRRRGFSGSMLIRRSDFDIPATGLQYVADDVNISVEAQLIFED